MFPPKVPFVEVVVHAERGADILKPVLDDGVAVLGDEGIERIGRLEIRQIRPRAKHPQSPQLATVLVRYEIVGIVGTRALEAEIADDLAGDQPSRHDAIGAVRSARDVLEQFLEVLMRETCSLAVRTPQSRIRIEF